MNTTNVTVRGWLVCVNGPELGMDYPLIMSPNGNGIGSGEGMTVVVSDANVLAENHATIFYDEMCGKSYIAPGFGKKAVRVNNMILFGATYLKPYDRISFGECEYAFIPLGGNIDPANTYVKIKNKQPHLDILREMDSCVCSPCVGWLVNRGPNQETYSLTSDFNYIGSSDNMDICIPGDGSIAPENHAAIVYDSSANKFFFGVYNTSSGCYVNGMPVNGFVPLAGFEEIGVGMSRLMFVPFCGEFFRW